MRWPAVRRKGYVIPAVWFRNVSVTCCLFPPALEVSHPVRFAPSNFILQIFQDRQDGVTAALPGTTMLVLTKRGLTLLVSSVGDHSMCKMGGGSVEDWVPRNEEERWHGCGLVSGLIERINEL